MPDLSTSSPRYECSFDRVVLRGDRETTVLCAQMSSSATLGTSDKNVCPCSLGTNSYARVLRRKLSCTKFAANAFLDDLQANELPAFAGASAVQGRSDGWDNDFRSVLF